MKHPISTFIISSTEMWGRFTFMLFSSSLVLFMMEVLHFSIALSTILYGIIMACCYLFQLITGYLTDRFLGNRKSIIIGSIIMLISFLIFTYDASLYYLTSSTPTHSSFIFTYPEIIFIIGIIFFTIGISFFKVSSTAFLGLFYKGKEELLDSAYTIFYMIGNIGAFFSPLILCIIVGQGNPHLHQYGFLVGAIILFLGIISFLMLKDKYLRLENGEPMGIEPVSKFIERKSELEKNKKLSKIEMDRIKVVCCVFVTGIVFLISVEQIATSLVLLTMEHVDTVVPYFNITLTPQFFICLNPLFVIMFSPIFIKTLSNLSNKNKEPSSINKLSIGLIMIVVAFTFLLIPTYISSGKISMVWIILFNIFMVFAELLIMPISYSLTSKLAPVEHASLIMGALLTATSLGEVLAGVFASSFPKHPNTTNYLFGFIPISNLSSFIWSFIIFTGVIMIVWLLLRNKLKELTHGID